MSAPKQDLGAVLALIVVVLAFMALLWAAGRVRETAPRPDTTAPADGGAR